MVTSREDDPAFSKGAATLLLLLALVDAEFEAGFEADPESVLEAVKMLPPEVML